MYEITDGLSGESTVLTERRAEKKHGATEFTMMVAGLHPRYTATNLSVEPDLDDCSNPLDNCFGMQPY